MSSTAAVTAGASDTTAGECVVVGLRIHIIQLADFFDDWKNYSHLRLDLETFWESICVPTVIA
jgi:hypothetical protein